MLICTFCGKDDFKKPQGLNGHIRMFHGAREQIPQQVEKVSEVSELWTEDVIRELAIQASTLISENLAANMLKMKQDSPAPLTTAKLQQVIHHEVVQLGQALKADLVKELKHHLCTEADCVICKPTVAGIRAQTIDKIEERLPGTMEGLQSYEALNTPIADLRFRTKL